MANTIDQIEAKTVGTAHAMKAGFNGLRGVFLHLAEEHGEVGSRMKRIAKNTDPRYWREQYSQIRADLLAHERGELSEVYPALGAYEATRDSASAHRHEAQQLEAAIGAVDELAYESAEWLPAFERLLALVQQHVAEEESYFFPLAQTVIDEEQSKVLLQRYEAAKHAERAHMQ